MHQPQLSKQVDYPFSDENDSDDKKDDDSLPDTSQQELHLETAIFASYLKKRSERGKAWKRRWFVLRPTRLSYYKNDQEYELHNIVRLDTIHAIGPIDAKKKEYAFGIVCKERTYYLQASSQEEMLEWISQLKKAIKGVYGSQQLSPRRESATKPESIRSSIVESILTTVSQPSAIESPLQVLAEPSPLEPLARDSDGLLQIVTEEQKKDAIIHQGFLYRLKGGLPRQWKNYWCVLRTRSMTLYRDEKEYEVRRMVPLDTVLSIHPIDPATKKGPQHCFKIVYGTKNWIMGTETKSEQEQWLDSLVGAHIRFQNLSIVPQ